MPGTCKAPMPAGSRLRYRKFPLCRSAARAILARPGSAHTPATQAKRGVSMAAVRQTRRRVAARLAVGIGALLGMAALLVGGWLLWSALRPAPAGFSPTIGRAVGAVGQPPTVLQYTIDARNRREWAYFDFSSAAEIKASLDSLSWDIAFKRTDVITNGGETNFAGAGAAVDLGRVPLQEADVAGAGFFTDVVDDERGLESPALHSWYSYNWTTHVVSSDKHAYGVKTATGETALMTFLSYYCDDGSAGCITFQYVYPVDPAPVANEP